MSISIRTFINWSPSSKPSRTEPTTTLVLTTPARTFVDLRYFLSNPQSDTRVHPPLDLTIPAHDLALRKPHLENGCASLDWGFSGVSTRSTLSDGNAHASFMHEIDSRTPDAASVTDEGVCTPQTDGGVAWELERGSMPDDEGVVRAYEEGWRDVPVDGDVVVCLKGVSAEACVVRVGGWVQGICRRGGGVGTVRWVLGEGWLRIAMSSEGMGEGDGGLEEACRLAMEVESQGLRAGGHVEIEGEMWRVVEVEGM